ncbi:hypothetical protein Tco_0733958 [Tanacetum coccineum]
MKATLTQSIGVNKDEVLSMASNAGCIAGDIPFNYLGLSIGSNMKSIASWKTLVDRFHMRLSSWKANLLLIGGRLTLIKSVLGSLDIYYLSIFRAPESVLQDLKRIRAKFFWGGNKDKNKMACFETFEGVSFVRLLKLRCARILKMVAEDRVNARDGP